MVPLLWESDNTTGRTEMSLGGLGLASSHTGSWKLLSALVESGRNLRSEARTAIDNGREFISSAEFAIANQPAAQLPSFRTPDDCFAEHVFQGNTERRLNPLQRRERH